MVQANAVMMGDPWAAALADELGSAAPSAKAKAKRVRKRPAAHAIVPLEATACISHPPTAASSSTATSLATHLPKLKKACLPQVGHKTKTG